MLFSIGLVFYREIIFETIRKINQKIKTSGKPMFIAFGVIVALNIFIHVFYPQILQDDQIVILKKQKGRFEYWHNAKNRLLLNCGANNIIFENTGKRFNYYIEKENIKIINEDSIINKKLRDSIYNFMYDAELYSIHVFKGKTKFIFNTMPDCYMLKVDSTEEEITNGKLVFDNFYFIKTAQ